MEFVLLLLAAAPLLFVISALVRPAMHALWGRRIAADSTGGPGPYRGHRRITGKDHLEPTVVRVTSLLSALLGGMVVPGVPAAIVAIVVIFCALAKLDAPHSANDVLIFLVALSAPSGIVIAGRSLAVYGPMLKNEADVVVRMRRLAWHSGIHNLILLGIYVVHAVHTGSLEGAVWGIYCVVSLIHVALLAVSARTIERRRHAHQEYLDAVGEPRDPAEAPSPLLQALTGQAPHAS
jgi:hypothetical protein